MINVYPGKFNTSIFVNYGIYWLNLTFLPFYLKMFGQDLNVSSVWCFFFLFFLYEVQAHLVEGSNFDAQIFDWIISL